MKNSISEKIKKHRKEKKFTLDELAEKSKISKSYLWELENNDFKSPSAEILARIADNLDVTTSYLLDSKQEELLEDDKDEIFYRNYKNLDEGKKSTVRAFLDFLNSGKK